MAVYLHLMIVFKFTYDEYSSSIVVDLGFANNFLRKKRVI